MKANRAYELKVTRSGAAPAFLADPERVDHIEVVEIDTLETVLFWDLTAADASLIARRLKSDLAQMEAEEFMSAWQGYEPYPAG